MNPVLESGVLEYIQQLKQAGTVRHIGLSSHTPPLVNKVLDMGVIDLVMFSINPGYDYRMERMPSAAWMSGPTCGVSSVSWTPRAARAVSSLPPPTS